MSSKSKNDEHAFSIELKSKEHVKRVMIPNVKIRQPVCSESVALALGF